MNIKITSVFIDSFNHIFHKKIFPIFLIHLTLTVVLAGIVTFYFYDFITNLTDGFTSYLSDLGPYSNFFLAIGNIIMMILSWLLFCAILIPISSITGLIFEDKLSDKIKTLSNSNWDLDRKSMSLVNFILLTLKNLSGGKLYEPL